MSQVTITQSASQVFIQCNDEDGELCTFTLSDQSSEKTISRTLGCVAHLTGMSKAQVEALVSESL